MPGCKPRLDFSHSTLFLLSVVILPMPHNHVSLPSRCVTDLPGQKITTSVLTAFIWHLTGLKSAFWFLYMCVQKIVLYLLVKFWSSIPLTGFVWQQINHVSLHLCGWIQPQEIWTKSHSLFQNDIPLLTEPNIRLAVLSSCNVVSLDIWFFLDNLTPEDGTITFSQNVRNHIPSDAASHLCRNNTSFTLFQKPKSSNQYKKNHTADQC
jgi:hypothetical protein